MTMDNVQGQRPKGCGCGASTQAVFTRGLALIDPPPLLTQAVDSCMDALSRLQSTVGSSDNPAHRSRDLARRETGVDVDANPYHGLTRDKIEAVIRAAFHARAMPEVLLAKWAKEGSTAMTLLAQTVTTASTAANAKTLLRSSIYYRQLGVDWLTVTRRPTPHSDNVLDETDGGAVAQERQFAARVAELVRGHFLAEDITAAVNGQLTVTSSGGTFSVQPSVRFYGLSLMLVDAVFARFLAMTFPQLGGVTEELGYILWNMGEAAFRTFLESADRHRREAAFLVNGQPISIEQWALHTVPRSTEYAQPRANAIRFAHYLRSYRPIFQNAINLIKPGIEDLRNAAAHTASFEDDPLGIAAPAPQGGRAASRAMTVPVPGGGHGAFRHAPLGGTAGNNVELRWNVPAGTAANATIDIVVHLHGYGECLHDCPTFLADKTTMAGVTMVDGSGNANVRVTRPTLAIVPRGRFVSGTTTWLWDNLPDAAAFNTLVRESLAWLAQNVLHLPAGATLHEGKCTIMAHSGGGAGLSTLLGAGVDPDEVVCYDSMYGGEAQIRTWALARIAGSRAATSALRVVYTGCSGPSTASPAGTWTWDAHHSRWNFGGTGSWSFRSGSWHLVTTEVSSRRLKEALDAALAPLAHAATLRPRFRVERTAVAHRDIPSTYTHALLDDIAVNLPRTSAPPPATTRPGCCANADWLTRAPVKPGGNDPPPPRPTAPPAAQSYGYGGNGSANGNGASRAFASAAARVIDVHGFAPLGFTPKEAPFTAPTKTWNEVTIFSKSRIGGFAFLKTHGIVTERGFDAFDVRVKGRLVVPGDLARRTGKVPFVVICMGNHGAFDSSGEIPSFEGYDYLQQALAASGYASMSVDTNPANAVDAGIRMRADLILATIQELKDHGEAAVVAKIDFDNMALVGHSRGGDAVVYATKLNRLAATPLGIKAVVSISPTDLSRGCTSARKSSVNAAVDAAHPPTTTAPVALPVAVPFSLTGADHVRYFVIYGSHDGDVSGDGDTVSTPVGATSERDGTGFSLYDRATCEKSMIFPRGITHNRFNTHWNNCVDYADPSHAFVINNCSTRNPAERFNVRIFSAAQHRELAVFYVGAFVDCVLKGDVAKEEIMRGKRALPPHTIAFQFLPANRLDVALTGGTPLQAFTVVQCPHDAAVVQAAAGTRLRGALGHVNLATQRKTSLTMRMGANYTVPDEATIAGEHKPSFTVRIVSPAGTSVATDRDLERLGSLDPDKPFFHHILSGPFLNVTKLALDTVVLPLSAFRPPIALTDVNSIEIEIGSGGTTPVFIDSVAFV